MSEEIKNTNIENETESSPRTEKDYKVIIDMTKEMEEQYKMFKELIVSSIRDTYFVNEGILEAMIPYTMEYIAEMDIELMREFINKYSISETPATQEIVSNAISNEESEEFNKTDAEIIREAFIRIKEQSIQLYTMKSEVDNIRKDSKSILNEYIEYASSEKVRLKRAERLDSMKKAAAELEDGPEKRNAEKMISIMESTQTLSFIFSRFNELGDAEVKSIVDSFFSTRKGAYIVNRFKKVITKFGFGETLFRYFFNLEENFLSDEYKPFNNLFLFIYMRFVGHADPYNKSDKMYVQALTSSMANLVYHRFEASTLEVSFIDTVKAILDKFMDYREKFENENTTQPNHPQRIAADNRRNQERRAALIDKMKELQITGYDENASADELQQYMNAKLEEMIQSQKPAEAEEVEVEEIDDITEEENTITE